MRARLATALLVASLGVTACSSEEPDEALPTLPPVTEAPSPTPEAVPSQAAEATPEGAAEFARYFLEEVRQAYLTADPARVQALSAPDCEACAAYISSISEIQKSGAKVADSYTLQVIDAAAPPLEPGAVSARVTVVSRTGEFVLTAPDGAELLREAPRDEAVQEITLTRAGDSWLTSSVVSDD